MLLGFSSEELEMCAWGSFLEVAQSTASCFDGEADLKFEQNSGALGRVLLFTGNGETTRSFVGVMPE